MTSRTNQGTKVRRYSSFKAASRLPSCVASFRQGLCGSHVAPRRLPFILPEQYGECLSCLRILAQTVANRSSNMAGRLEPRPPWMGFLHSLAMAARGNGGSLSLSVTERQIERTCMRVG
jgi:hypothetical protein